jgi:hypothetical protein
MSSEFSKIFLYLEAISTFDFAAHFATYDLHSSFISKLCSDFWIPSVCLHISLIVLDSMALIS